MWGRAGLKLDAQSAGGDYRKLAQVDVDGDDFAGERYDCTCRKVECADDFSGAVTDGHCRGCDDVMASSFLKEVARLADDNVLRNLYIQSSVCALGCRILGGCTFGAVPGCGDNAGEHQDFEKRDLHIQFLSCKSIL